MCCASSSVLSSAFTRARLHNRVRRIEAWIASVLVGMLLAISTILSNGRSRTEVERGGINLAVSTPKPWKWRQRNAKSRSGKPRSNQGACENTYGKGYPDAHARTRGSGSNAASAPHLVAAMLLILRATQGCPGRPPPAGPRGRPPLGSWCGAALRRYDRARCTLRLLAISPRSRLSLQGTASEDSLSCANAMAGGIGVGGRA
jgi:hypothetical protein